MNDINKLIASGAVQTVGDLLTPQPDSSSVGAASGPAIPPAGSEELVLVFDTETTGLPLWSKPSDLPEQPHIVSLAAELCTSTGEVLETYNQIVKIGVPIPQETIDIHGITDEIANAQGIAPEKMLNDFLALIDRAGLVVGYNTGFDLRLVRIQAARHLGRKWDCPLPKDDAMWIVAKELGIPKPKLTAAYRAVFGEDFDGAHNAMADCTATRRIYFEMRNRGYVAGNVRALPGGNMPPPDEPQAAAPVVESYATVKQEIDDLYEEAKNWLDGEPITTEGQASDLAKLRDKIRDAEKRGEALRKAEAEVFDAGKKAVQDRYNPLVHKDKGLCALAISTCNNALAPYLRKKEADQKAIADKARAEADRVAREALDAAQAAATSTNIEQRERAEDLLGQAKTLLGGARRAEAVKPQVAGGTRAVGLKSVFTAELVDPTKAIEHYRVARPAALKEWLREQAAADVRSGMRGDSIPGFSIKEDRVPV